MGTDDLFKKRREERKRRKYEFRNPRANSFLIVTEGERTEPLYFAGMKKKSKRKSAEGLILLKIRSLISRAKAVRPEN